MAKFKLGLISTDADPLDPSHYSLTMSEDKIFKIIKSAPNKLCDLDLIPIFSVCDCICIILTPITNSVNYSLQRAVSCPASRLYMSDSSSRKLFSTEIPIRTINQYLTSAISPNLLRKLWPGK